MTNHQHSVITYNTHRNLCLAAGLSFLISANVRSLRLPVPSVVLSTVSSCMRIGTPSLVNSRSSSIPVAPFFAAWKNQWPKFNKLLVLQWSSYEVMKNLTSNKNLEINTLMSEPKSIKYERM